MKKACLLLAFLSFALPSFGDTEAALSPMEEVKNTVEKLKREKNKEAIRQIILGSMDFEEMAKLSLGRYWLKISEEERQEFVEVFSRFVEVFYRDRVLNSLQHIGKVEIRYLKERITGDGFAEVEVEVKTPQDEFKILYRLRLVGGKWKAYDIVVEGVSIALNYRAQFDRIIERYEFGGLLARLREKIKELDK